MFVASSALSVFEPCPILAQRPSKWQPVPSLSDLYSRLRVYKGERKLKLRLVCCLSSQESYFISSAKEGKSQHALFTLALHLRLWVGAACPASLMLERPQLPPWCQGKKQPTDASRGTVSLRDRLGALSSEIITNPDRKNLIQTDQCEEFQPEIAPAHWLGQWCALNSRFHLHRS